MKITMWVMFIVGLIEMVFNLFFLINKVRNNDFTVAKKFHGDFPKFASDIAWINKIVASMILGAIALVASLLIYLDHSMQVIVSGVFVGGMLIMCIVEAVLYGKEHLPARLSLLLGFALVALVVFRI